MRATAFGVRRAKKKHHALRTVTKNNEHGNGRPVEGFEVEFEQLLREMAEGLPPSAPGLAPVQENPAPDRRSPGWNSDEPNKPLPKLSCMLHPQQPSKAVWDVLISGLIIYSVLVEPFRFCFHVEVDVPTMVIDILVDLLFVSDIVSIFFTAYYDEREALVTDRWMIARRYLLGFFVVDVISVFPGELLVMLIEPELASQARVVKLLRLVRLGRLFKLKRLLLLIEEKLHITLQMMEMLKMLLKVLFIVHLLACLTFLVATPICPDGMGPCRPRSDELDFWSNWVRMFQIDEFNLMTRYLSSFHFITATLMAVGYGDIYPSNSLERIMCIVSQITGAVLFGFLLSCITAVLEFTNPSELEHKKRMAEIKNWLRGRSLPQNLKMQVWSHFCFVTSRRALKDRDQTLLSLPTHLRSQLVESSQRLYFQALQAYRAGLRHVGLCGLRPDEAMRHEPRTSMNGYRLDRMLEAKDGDRSLQVSEGFWVGEKGFEKSQWAQGYRYRMRASPEEVKKGIDTPPIFQLGPIKIKLGEMLGGTGNNDNLRRLKKEIAQAGLEDPKKIAENEYWLKRYGHKRWFPKYVDQSGAPNQNGLFRGLAAWSGFDPLNEERGTSWIEADYGKPLMKGKKDMQLPGLLTKEQMQLEPLGRTNDPGPRSLRENEGQRQAIGSSFVFQVRLIDGSGSIGIAVLGEALLAALGVSEKSFVAELVFQVAPMQVPFRMCIIEAGEVTTEIYIISSGRLEAVMMEEDRADEQLQAFLEICADRRSPGEEPLPEETPATLDTEEMEVDRSQRVARLKMSKSRSGLFQAKPISWLAEGVGITSRAISADDSNEILCGIYEDMEAVGHSAVSPVRFQGGSYNSEVFSINQDALERTLANHPNLQDFEARVRVAAKELARAILSAEWAPQGSSSIAGQTHRRLKGLIVYRGKATDVRQLPAEAFDEVDEAGLLQATIEKTPRVACKRRDKNGRVVTETEQTQATPWGAPRVLADGVSGCGGSGDRAPQQKSWFSEDRYFYCMIFYVFQWRLQQHDAVQRA
ncbi:Potassium channel AKT2 [Durusdinium trenchii]|uniref:Potassium channel AKT2 n=1 Tax=Durusdinium trenchii TaxID=1381693 RepID=A0ABP0HRW5_9DINO